ncbi:MAG: hypothetical protein K9M13_00625 [Simkaniaceae bacterium]|nr:hypothetical protein [Simkaniaceae bacterium]
MRTRIAHSGAGRTIIEELPAPVAPALHLQLRSPAISLVHAIKTKITSLNDEQIKWLDAWLDKYKEAPDERFLCLKDTPDNERFLCLCELHEQFLMPLHANSSYRERPIIDDLLKETLRALDAASKPLGKTSEACLSDYKNSALSLVHAIKVNITGLNDEQLKWLDAWMDKYNKGPEDRRYLYLCRMYQAFLTPLHDKASPNDRSMITLPLSNKLLDILDAASKPLGKTTEDCLADFLAISREAQIIRAQTKQLTEAAVTLARRADDAVQAHFGAARSALVGVAETIEEDATAGATAISTVVERVNELGVAILANNTEAHRLDEAIKHNTAELNTSKNRWESEI